MVRRWLEVLENGEITVLETMDMVGGVIAIVPGVGWIISGSYFILRLTVTLDMKFGIEIEMDNGIRRFGEL